MEEKELIYQVTRDIDELKDVVIDIVYSGDIDEEGNEITEYVYSVVEEESNPHLTKDQIDEANSILESGWEEDIVSFLKEEYEGTSIRFDIGEWKYNPTSVLYDPTVGD
jgi:hypothetical protein